MNFCGVVFLTGRLAVHVYCAGAGAILPAASIALTANLWLPLARPVYAAGLAQASSAPSSSEQRNFAPGSDDVNLKVAAVESTGSSGWLVIVVSGGVVSKVTAALFIAETFPTVSLNQTERNFFPSPRLRV